MDGDGSFIPGSMPAFERASRGGRFEEGGASDEEDDDDVGRGYFSKRVRGRSMWYVCWILVGGWWLCSWVFKPGRTGGRMLMSLSPTRLLIRTPHVHPDPGHPRRAGDGDRAHAGGAGAG